MQLYLPIADIPVNVFLILAMGAAVGFVSGMFGIGGGFLMTPLLIFVGIAPAVDATFGRCSTVTLHRGQDQTKTTPFLPSSVRR